MGDHATINNPSATEATFAEKGKGKAQDPELSMEEDTDSESDNGDEMVCLPCALPVTTGIIYPSTMMTLTNSLQ